MKDPHIQVELRNDNVTMVVWLPRHSKLKVGNSMTLKEKPDTLWSIEWVGQVPVDKSQLNRTWNNNI